jgi:hypothetical protein
MFAWAGNQAPFGKRIVLRLATQISPDALCILWAECLLPAPIESEKTERLLCIGMRDGQEVFLAPWLNNSAVGALSSIVPTCSSVPSCPKLPVKTGEVHVRTA